MSLTVPTRVSVIVPTRDRSALLREALTSVRAIEGPDLAFDIIVANDGSSDATADVARELGATVVDVSPPGSAAGRGTAAGRNAGLRVATGDFVTFLDDDDLWLPGHIRPHLAMLRSDPDLAMVVGQLICTDEARRPTTSAWPDFAPNEDGLLVQFRHTIQISAFVARMSVRDTVGYFDESLPEGYDADWTYRVATRHRAGCVAEPCVLFRQRTDRSPAFDEAQIRRNWDNGRTFIRAARRAGRRRPPLARLAYWYVHQRGVYYWYFVETAQQRTMAGDRSGARRAVMAALKVSPLHCANDLRRPSVLRSVMRSLLVPGPVVTPARTA